MRTEAMTATIPTRMRTLAVVLTLAVLTLALVLSPQARAREHGPLCTRSAAGHSKHGAHPCTGPGAASSGKSHGKGGKSHTHSRGGGHNAKSPSRRPASAGGGEGAEEAEEGGEAVEHGQSSGSAGGSQCEGGSTSEAETEGEETALCEA